MRILDPNSQPYNFWKAKYLDKSLNQLQAQFPFWKVKGGIKFNKVHRITL
jgi:hypothetical protein